LLISEAKAEGPSWFSPGQEPRPPDRNEDYDMTQKQKIIRPKLGLLELTERLLKMLSFRTVEA